MEKFNFYLGAASSAWLLVALVVIAEIAEPFKNFLKGTFTHHWIGKAVLATIAFLLFGFLFKGKTSIGNIADEKLAWYSAIGSLLAIFLFFIVDFFK